jgi:hypothetical protein
MRRFILFILLTISVQGICNAQTSNKSGSKNHEKGLLGKTPGNTKKVKSNKPVSPGTAKRNQEKKEKQLKKDYAKSIELSQKRTYDIQSPEVQARMKQNQKDTEQRDKQKKKNTRASTKKAGKKYS